MTIAPERADQLHEVELTVNGSPSAVRVEPRRTLVDLLRYDLALTGTKEPCGMGDCGACTVHLDGRAVYSCLVLAVDCDGREVRTIEGLARASGTSNGLSEDDLHEGRAALDPVQQAFIECDALQCGFCTPGQVMALRALLDEDPTPDDAAIRRAVTGNLCRCGAYANILRAGQRAAELARERHG